MAIAAAAYDDDSRRLSDTRFDYESPSRLLLNCARSQMICKSSGTNKFHFGHLEQRGKKKVLSHLTVFFSDTILLKYSDGLIK